MALVELFRTTGERRYLELAARFVEAARRTACSGSGVSARRTGRTTLPSATRRRWPATPSASCTSTAVRSTSPPSSAIDELLDAVDAALARHDRDPDVPDRRSRAAATATRRSATRTSCRPTAPTPRRARRSPASCSPGGCSSRRATPAYADVIERTVYNGVLPGLSLDGTGFFYVNTLQRRTERVAGDEGDGDTRSRGSPAPAARRTSCAC